MPTFEHGLSDHDAEGADDILRHKEARNTLFGRKDRVPPQLIQPDGYVEVLVLPLHNLRPDVLRGLPAPAGQGEEGGVGGSEEDGCMDGRLVSPHGINSGVGVAGPEASRGDRDWVEALVE